MSLKYGSTVGKEVRTCQDAHLAFQSTGVLPTAPTFWNRVWQNDGVYDVDSFMDSSLWQINPHHDTIDKKIVLLKSWVDTAEEYLPDFNLLHRTPGIGLPVNIPVLHRFALNKSGGLPYPLGRAEMRYNSRQMF